MNFKGYFKGFYYQGCSKDHFKGYFKGDSRGSTIRVASRVIIRIT